MYLLREIFLFAFIFKNLLEIFNEEANVNAV